MRSPGASAWARRAGARRPGRRQYGGGGLSNAEARVLQQEMARVGAYNPIAGGGMGVTMIGPTILDYGTEEQKAAPHPADREGRSALVRRLLRARRRLRPRLAADQVRGQGRPLAGQRPEDLDLAARSTPTGAAAWCAPTPAKKHEGISFLLHPHAPAGRRDAADPADRRRLAVLRDLLHRRQGAEGRHAGPAQRRLDGRQAPAAARARQPDRRRQSHGRRPRRSRCRTSPRATSESTTTGRIADAGPARAARPAPDGRPGARPDHRPRARRGEERRRQRRHLDPEELGDQRRPDPRRADAGDHGPPGPGLGGRRRSSPTRLQAVRGWLSGKAMSIYGGSAEIQNNIISKRILGLPDPTQST